MRYLAIGLLALALAVPAQAEQIIAIYGTASCPKKVLCNVNSENEMEFLDSANSCMTAKFGMTGTVYQDTKRYQNQDCTFAKPEKPKGDAKVLTPYCCVQKKAGGSLMNTDEMCDVVCSLGAIK
jgi:hypothetical protein